MSQALEAPTLRTAIATLGYEQTYAVTLAAVTKGMEYFGEAQRMPPGSVTLFAEMLMEKYPLESVDDISLFLRNAAFGQYGEKNFDGEIVKKGETYGQLTLTRLGSWWEQYLCEKADAMGAARTKESAAFKSQLMDISPAILKVVKDVAEKTSADRENERLLARILKLRDHLPRMDDEELRQAYTLHPTAEERAMIMAEADARGLIKKAMDEALAEEEPEITRSNEPVAEIVTNAQEVTEPKEAPTT